MSDEPLGQDSTDDQTEVLMGNSSAEEGGLSEAPPGFSRQKVPEKKGHASRLLLLLLLLVAAVGAGFYFFGQDLIAPETSVVRVPPATPGKMKVPLRPEPPADSEGVKEELVSKEKVAVVATRVEKVPTKVPHIKPEIAVKPVAAPAFTLSSGAYLYRGALKKALAQVKKMGYKVQQSQKSEPHEMTRLLVGHYARAMANKRLTEVQNLSDGAFLVAENGQFAVYAGSYISLDKARRAADQLYQSGLRVDERKITVALAKTTLHFGSFATRSEAKAVAQKLQQKGVKDPRVVSIK